MGWLPSFLGGKASDPYSALDPKLREFLDKESPVKYSEASKRSSSTSVPKQTVPPNPTASQPPSADVARESLFQDGRYAHLWKNYRPLAEIEEENATDHDKMMNVLEGFNERKAAIGRAALENCAIQQEDWVNCTKSGSWEGRLTMCSEQVRRYERCYTMQHRFLRALGYGGVIGRSPEVEERIQMHADSLYQRMLAHDEQVEQAKKDGRPIPVFEFRVPSSPSEPSVFPTDQQDTTKGSVESSRQWKEKLEPLPPEERAAEEAALQKDREVNAGFVKDLQQLQKTQKEEREARRLKGEATWSDSLTALFGTRK